ncbi:hypothetical protein [Thiomicrospira sp.]|uniref:hypothetical protein n=1 Tax=Thiomicrospira sp. TaxID=935 RepID=UPI002F93EA52
MDLFIQFGHGMMGHSKKLIEEWGEGTVIISPRDLTIQQIEKFSKSLSKLNGKTLFDPQYYNPRANHKKLTNHTHWFEDFVTIQLTDQTYISKQLKFIKDLNNDALTYAYIIPSVACEAVDKHWLRVQDIFIHAASQIFTDKPRYITLALNKNVLLDETAIELLIETSKQWDVDGFYLVPEGSYLEKNVIWMENLGLLVAGLKLTNKVVIVGYSNHQMLSLACSNADAIASGNFLNVRAFNAEKFDAPEEGSVSRRSLWYYCPQALSEYKLSDLELAHRNGFLDELKPYGRSNQYIEKLFKASSPSDSGFDEGLAFRHYLTELKKQCQLSTKSSFEDTKNFHLELLENAYNFSRSFRKKGIRKNDRSFEDIAIDNITSVQKLSKELGAKLSRNWL